jgi:hypothetical protein
MSLEVLKCPNCGAPMPADVVAAVVVCAYCTRSVANPAALRAAPQAAPVAQAPVAQAPVAQAPVAQAPVVAAAATVAAPGKPAVTASKPVVKGPSAPVVTASKPVVKGPSVSVGKGKPTLNVSGAAQKGAVASDDDEEEYDEEFEWTEEGITEYAQECLGEHASLFFHPKVPKDKLKAARKVHDASLDSDERVLVLFDDTVFGGADDGFIVTVEQLAWKNIMEEPKQFYWSDIDPEQVEWSEEGLTVMDEAIQISQADGSVMYPALGEFIYEMASMAAEDEEEEEDA